MAHVIIPHRWTRQPPGPLRVNHANPLSQGLFVAFAGSQRAIELAGGLGTWASAGNEIADHPGLVASLVSAQIVGGGIYTSRTAAPIAQADPLSFLCNYNYIVGGGYIVSRADSGPREFGFADSASGTGNLDVYKCGYAGAFVSLLTSGWNRYGVSIPGAGSSVTASAYKNGASAGTASLTIGTDTVDVPILIGARWNGYPASFGFVSSGNRYSFIFCWKRELQAAEFLELERAPWQMFAPLRRRLYFGPPAAAGQTVTVNQALETDLAQAITRLKAKTLGQATETDLAQAITRRKTLAIGQALETDLAQAVTHAKAKLLGQATETDTAQAIAHAKAKAIAQATETDLAQAITASGNKIIAVGQVAETDAAQPLTARKAKQLGQTTETDLAQAVAHAKTKALGQATETDLAQAITPSIPNQVGQAVETDLAQTITRLKTKALGQTTETDLAQAITHAKTKGLGLALEIDLGQPIALAPKRRLVAQATETDLAQTIVPSLSSVQLPQGKRYVVGARVGYRVGARNNFRVDQ